MAILAVFTRKKARGSNSSSRFFDIRACILLPKPDENSKIMRPIELDGDSTPNTVFSPDTSLISSPEHPAYHNAPKTAVPTTWLHAPRHRQKTYDWTLYE